MRLFIYCAGGFGREVFDSADRINRSDERWDEISFIDDVRTEKVFYGAKVFKLEAVLAEFSIDSFEVTIANGEPKARKDIFGRLVSNNINLATLVDRTSVVSGTARMGRGVILTPFCSVSSQAVIGNNVAVNTKAIVGHDVKLGDHSVVSSMVNIGGACSIGEDSYIGMGAQIKEGGIMIGKEVIVGMGSVVYDDIPDGMIALGNPARPMRRNVDKKVFRNSK